MYVWPWRALGVTCKYVEYYSSAVRTTNNKLLLTIKIELLNVDKCVYRTKLKHNKLKCHLSIKFRLISKYFVRDIRWFTYYTHPCQLVYRVGEESLMSVSEQYGVANSNIFYCNQFFQNPSPTHLPTNPRVTTHPSVFIHRHLST